MTAEFRVEGTAAGEAVAEGAVILVEAPAPDPRMVALDNDFLLMEA
jgi:hypothetical protein